MYIAQRPALTGMGGGERRRRRRRRLAPSCLFEEGGRTLLQEKNIWLIPLGPQRGTCLVRMKDFQKGAVDFRVVQEAGLDLVDIANGVVELH